MSPNDKILISFCLNDFTAWNTYLKKTNKQKTHAHTHTHRQKKLDVLQVWQIVWHVICQELKMYDTDV